MGLQMANRDTDPLTELLCCACCRAQGAWQRGQKFDCMLVYSEGK